MYFTLCTKLKFSIICVNKIKLSKIVSPISCQHPNLYFKSTDIIFKNSIMYVKYQFLMFFCHFTLLLSLWRKRAKNDIIYFLLNIFIFLSNLQFFFFAFLLFHFQRFYFSLSFPLYIFSIICTGCLFPDCRQYLKIPSLIMIFSAPYSECCHE